MATKPLVQPEAWATDAVYTTGPFIGQPQKVVPPGAFAAEGHRPGALFPTPAEYENSQQNRITELSRWLFLGSFNPDADAHVVEADSTGRAGLHGLDVVNVDAAETAVEITAATTAGLPAVLLTCTAGADAGVEVDIGAADSFAFKTALGAALFAAGYYVDMVGAGGGCAGVRCIADAATTGAGVAVAHDGGGDGITVSHTGAGDALVVDASTGTGSAVIVTGNATIRAMTITGGAGQAALLGTSGNNASAAIGALGVGTAIGMDASGGSGSSAAIGARGTGVHADAYGVHGRTSVSASTTAAGVFGEGRGTGTMGVYARSDAGIGLVAQGDASSPANPAARLVPQNADPTNIPTGGELLSHSVMGQLRHARSGTYRGIYQGGTNDSSACIFNTAAAGPFTSNSTVIWTTCLTPYLADSSGNGYYGVGVGSEVTITIWFTPRTQTAADATLSLQVLDNTDGGTVILDRSTTGTTLTDGYRLQSATTNWLTSISISFQYSPPNEGDLDLQIDIRVGDGAGANIEIRDIGCQIWGAIIP